MESGGNGTRKQDRRLPKNNTGSLLSHLRWATPIVVILRLRHQGRSRSLSYSGYFALFHPPGFYSCRDHNWGKYNSSTADILPGLDIYSLRPPYNLLRLTKKIATSVLLSLIHLASVSTIFLLGSLTINMSIPFCLHVARATSCAARARPKLVCRILINI